MKIDVKNGELLLVKSGSVLSYEDTPIKLIFDDQYCVSFQFLEDVSFKEHKINVDTVEGGIDFKLINFNNPLGIAIGKPIVFAEKDGKSVYISFSVYSVGKSKTLHYNVYTEQ